MNTWKLELTNEPIPIDSTEVLFRDFLDARHPREAHAQPELVHEEAEAQLDPVPALVRQAPEDGPADPAKVRPQGQGLEDVGAVPDAPVDVDGDLAVDGGDHLGQGVESGQGAVELAASVVGHDDPVDAVVDGQGGVLGRRHPLDPDRHLGPRAGLEPGDRLLPGQRRVGRVGVERDRARGRVSFVSVVVTRHALFGFCFRFRFRFRFRVGVRVTFRRCVGTPFVWVLSRGAT